MNKRTVVLLGFVMGLALLSLVSVQIYWINNAFHVKEKQFDQLVLRALSDMAYKMEQEETYELIVDEFFTDYQDSMIYQSMQPYLDTILELNNLTIEESSPTNQYPEITTLNRSNKMLSNSAASNTKLINDSLIQNTQSISNSLQDDKVTEQQLYEKKKYLNKVLQRMFSRSPDISNRVTPDEMDAILKETLGDYGIDLGFKFSVYKWRNVMAYQSKGYKPQSISSIYEVRLFPDDVTSQNNFLHIYFPDRRNYIISSLGLMGIISGVLTILIVFTFAFTLFIIFRQKKSLK